MEKTLPPDIRGAMWWLERRFPEQFGRRDQMEHSGGVKVQATQTQELTIDLVKSDGTVHRVSRGMSYKDAAMAGGIHEETLAVLAQARRPRKKNTAYTRFIGQIERAAEKTAIDYLEAIRKSIMESPVKVREHIKKDESGKVILTEIHRETLPPDIRGAMWWLERRFPEQFGRRDQMEHSGGVKVQATQTQELTIDLVKSDGTVHRVSRGMSYKDAAMAGGIHEETLAVWRKRGAAEKNTAYTRFIGQIERAAEKTAIDYLEAIRKSIMESPVKVREHIKKDESGKVILTEIHRETLPPDIRGAMWWLERRFPEQFGRRDQMEHSGGVKVPGHADPGTHDRSGEIRWHSAPAHAQRCDEGSGYC